MTSLDLEAVVAFIRDRLEVSIVTGSADSGAPEIAWGDLFFYAGPFVGGEPPQRMPFATIVTKDYPGFDEASALDRPGAFRLNVGVGRTIFQQAFPEWSGDGEFDFAAVDVVMPHPVYWPQSWVSVVRPSLGRLGELEGWLASVYQRAADRRT